MREWFRSLLRALPDHPLSIFMLAALAIAAAAVVIATGGMD